MHRSGFLDDIAIAGSDENNKMMDIIEQQELMQGKYIKLEVSVIDNGYGISEEGVKALFKDYSKLAENEDKNQKGTGLGLTICKQIVEVMGGNIMCLSQQGIGTEFRLNIPIKAKVIDMNTYVSLSCLPKTLIHKPSKEDKL